MSKKFISPNRGNTNGGSEPYRLFALTIIEHAVNSIDEWIHRRAPNGMNHASQRRRLQPENYRRRCLDIAVDAYLWLFGNESGTRGLTLQVVCDGLGLDIDCVQQGIIERFSKYKRFEVLADIAEGRQRKLVAS